VQVDVNFVLATVAETSVSSRPNHATLRLVFQPAGCLERSSFLLPWSLKRS
jgi:hypothetical protein